MHQGLEQQSKTESKTTVIKLKTTLRGLLFPIGLTLALACCSAAGKEITIIASPSTPPYVNAETGTGLVLDIFTKALAAEGYTVKFIYAPNRRVAEEVESKRVDGAFNAAGAKNVYFSDSVITFQNTAVSLKSKQYTINSAADLADKRILAFQNATYLLTPEFSEMVKKNPRYVEVDNQEFQVPMLLLDRTDVIVMERGIFYFYLNSEKTRARTNVRQPYVMHNIFPPSQRFAAFHDSTLRDEFNAGLKLIRANGEYKKLTVKYGVEQPD